MKSLTRAVFVTVLVVLAVTACGACSEEGTNEKLTVVVEADRTRALADQSRLAEMQASLVEATQELVDTRKDLTRLRERLLKAGALTSEEMKRLENREARLIAREGGSVLPSTPVGSGLSKADVEELLRAQEDRMRVILASNSAPSASPASPAPGADSVEGSPEAVLAQLVSIAALRSQRGLREDDVEGGPALKRRVDDALKAKRTRVALDAVGELRSKTEGTVVNGAFVKQKYARASARLEVLSLEAKTTAKRLLGDANTKNAKGDAAGANEALNAVLELK